MVSRYRLMQPKDVRECVELIATHPVVGSRYGAGIKGLEQAWLRLLGRSALQLTLMEWKEGSRTRICFVGVSVCVTDSFLRELKTPPLFWVGPELTKRALRGEFPGLSDKQLREANSCGGLNLVVWEGCIRAEFEKKEEIHREIMRGFIEIHGGYLWKEAIASQMESVERLQWTLQTGGMLWNAEQGCYVDSVDGDPAEFISRPHLAGVTREMESNRLSTWIGNLFTYHPPILGFSRSEQQLLLAALDGITDQELAERLHLSLPAVKKKWFSIYNRVAAGLPDLLPHSLTDDEPSQRGKEKRRPLLIYLREHPEELRPVSRRLLQAANQRRRA